MKLLLDTHILLWWLNDSEDLTDNTKSIIADPQNLVLVSAVSLWEIVIKESLGKLKMPKNWSTVICEESFRQLSVTWGHSLRVATLPNIHRDPFDRLLIAQAIIEGLSFVTNDGNLLEYPCEIFVNR